MTNTEIKKLYTKTKKALEKRIDQKFTWVMNNRQQQLGTATVCVAYATDSVANVEHARVSANGKAKAEAEKYCEFLMREVAKEEAEEAAGVKSWNPRFWRDRLEEVGNLDEYVAEAQRKAEEKLAKAEQYLAEHGTQAQIVVANNDFARQLIAGPEISAFLKAIGGSATIENKTEYGISTYIRFHYTATEA